MERDILKKAALISAEARSSYAFINEHKGTYPTNLLACDACLGEGATSVIKVVRAMS